MNEEEREFYAEPVHDLEAEKYTLACMMLSPAATEEAAEMLDVDSFYRPAHRVLFRALVLMMAAGEPTDPVSLRAWLTEEGDMRTLGDGGRGLLLAELAGMPAAPAMVGRYARIVLRHAARRGMIEAGTQLIQHARTGDLDETTLVGRGHAILDRVLTAGGGSTTDMPGVTADEFCDADDINAEPLIPGLLYRMERVIIVGPEGAGKSILALQMAFASASGVHPFQHRVQTEPVKVLVVDLENPPHIVQRRFRTFRSIAANYAGWDGKNVTLLHKPGGLDLTSPRDSYGLAQLIKRSGAQLVVAGPIYKMLSGVDAEINAYAKVAAFWDRMREDHGITVWLEAHAPFGAGGDKREMRPEGSNLWAKWPEFGVGLKWAKKNHGGANGLEWTDFRGQRDAGRAWPSWITRNFHAGAGWPWNANYDRPVFQPPLYDGPDGD